uniref:Transmembrane protein n=1 Tax=Strongyloides stercoralis TaxID=6248 RepID=A0A0K0DZH1_STRER
MSTFIEPGGTINFQRNIKNVSIVKPNNIHENCQLFLKKKVKEPSKLINHPSYLVNLDHYEEMIKINSTIHIHNNLCCYKLFSIKSVAYFIGYLELLTLVILTSYYITQLIVHGFTFSSLLLIPICILQLCLTITLHQGLKNFNTVLLIISLISFIGRVIFCIIYLITYFFFHKYQQSDNIISESKPYLVQNILISVYACIMLISSYIIYRCYSYYQKVISILP